tara:strand:+ start:118 stop:396 length:279 start_codon:yes stop_codon:yes gene_type:complete
MRIKNKNCKQNIEKSSYLLNQIDKPLVCVKCSFEFTSGQTDAKSLQDYSKFDVGFTNRGFQVWCRRHEVNVCHFKFGNKQPEADFRCLEKRK